MLHVAESDHTKSPVFAQELMIEIAEHLVTSYSLKTLASLNIASRQTHAATLRVLYRHLILVTRDPHGIEEWEKPLMLGPSIPEGWKYTEYLSVGPINHERLLSLGAALGSESPDIDPLRTLLPCLGLLCLRTPELQSDKEYPGPSSPPPSAFGFEITRTTKVAVHIYRSITPSDLLSSCVIGTLRRKTACALNTFRPAIAAKRSRGCDVLDVLSPGIDGDFGDDTLCDNIHKISFAPCARFLVEDKEAVEEDVSISGSEASGGFLIVDGSTMDNDDSPGSRSRDIARGLLGMLSVSESVEKGQRAVYDTGLRTGVKETVALPTVVLHADHAIYKPFAKEILAHLPVRAALHITQPHCRDLTTFSKETKDIGAAYRAKWQETALSTHSADVPFFQLVADASDFCSKTRYQATFQVQTRSYLPPSDGAVRDERFADEQLNERGFMVMEIIESHGVTRQLSTFYPADLTELPTEIVAAPAV